MSHTKLFNLIDNKFQEYVALWEEICRIESPSDFKEGVDRVGDFVTEIAKKHGWQVEIHKEKISGNAVAITMNSGSKEAPFAISAHMDTVHPVGSFGKNPVRRDGNYLYGPGVIDCKAGIIQSLLVMVALEEIGFSSRPIILLLQSDEEVGSRTSEKRTVKFMCEKAKEAVAFINLEGSSEGYACIRRRGIAYFRFTVKGVGAHATRAASFGASAILEAANKIIEIEKYKDEDGISFNVGKISGGTVMNSVPAECIFTVDARFKSAQEFEKIKQIMENLAKTPENPRCEISYEIIGTRLAMELVDRNLKLLDKANSIFRKCGLSELKAGKGNGGSDAADITAYGIPCLDSLSASGGDVHSLGEFGNIESLREASKRLAALIYYI